MKHLDDPFVLDVAPLSTQRVNAGELFDLESGGLGWLTYLGLSIAAIGWLMLIATLVGIDVVATRGRAGLLRHEDLVDVAMCLVGSGFALALLGGLRAGFGALARFFDIVLSRSVQRAVAVASVVPDLAPSLAEPFDQEEPIVKRDAETLRERRPFTILDDGSVEVETILGSRRFASIYEARDFI